MSDDWVKNYIKPGALRIGADSDGIIQVYKNGRAFTNESEISEFLLKPLLDHFLK